MHPLLKQGQGLTRALITFVRGPSSHAIKDGCFCFNSLRRSPPGPCPCSIILEAFNSSKIWPESSPALSASAWAFLIDCCSSLIYKGNLSTASLQRSSRAVSMDYATTHQQQRPHTYLLTKRVTLSHYTLIVGGYPLTQGLAASHATESEQ